MAGEDKLIRIFKQLRFEEQLSLASESDRLRNVFENHIWKVNYRTLDIRMSKGGFVVSNETLLDRVFITDETLRHFIEFYGENVKIVISDQFFDTKLFKNLISLNMSWSDVYTDEFIPIIAKNLEHLESLVIREFCTNDSIVKSETVSALLQMKKLKHLRLSKFLYADLIIKYKQFCQLASKLETLGMSAILKPDLDYGNSETEHATLTNSDQLKELDIYTTFDPSNWTHKYLEFLSTFKSLTTLSMKITDEIDNCMWSIFVTSCQELKKLTMKETDFKNITYFFVPPKLNELKLISCKGLSYTNLKQILQDAKLTEFRSVLTSYEGEFKDFKIGSTIRTLDIRGIDMCKFRSAYDRNENLKNLKWSKTHESCINTECMKSLALCKNLETLDLRPLTQVTLDSLLQLNHLRELSTSIVKSTHWSCFIDLLKHSSLSELTVYIAYGVNITPTKGLPTNISTLKVHCDSMHKDEFGLDFFLDLFSQNADLQLSFGAIHVVKLLKLLINHSNFPRNLKTIIVCGFTLNCDDLLRNFDDTIARFNQFMFKYGKIDLCRNQSVN